MRVNGRARVNPRAPRAFAICDRCGGLYNHYRLQWQYTWAGGDTVRTGDLVCPTCLDKLNPNLRAIRIPPDPTPIIDPRPEFYSDYETDYRITEDGDRRIIYPGDEPRIVDYNVPPGATVRAAADFDPIDPGEVEVFAFDFFRLVGNQQIDVAYWVIETMNGEDVDPSSRLIGGTVIAGSVVSHRIGNLITGALYRLQATAVTTSGSSYTLWSQVQCNTIS